MGVGRLVIGKPLQLKVSGSLKAFMVAAFYAGRCIMHGTLLNCDGKNVIDKVTVPSGKQIAEVSFAVRKSAVLRQKPLPSDSKFPGKECLVSFQENLYSWEGRPHRLPEKFISMGGKKISLGRNGSNDLWMDVANHL
jgi:hypothetical protein